MVTRGRRRGACRRASWRRRWSAPFTVLLFLLLVALLLLCNNSNNNNCIVEAKEYRYDPGVDYAEEHHAPLLQQLDYHDILKYDYQQQQQQQHRSKKEPENSNHPEDGDDWRADLAQVRVRLDEATGLPSLRLQLKPDARVLQGVDVQAAEIMTEVVVGIPTESLRSGQAAVSAYAWSKAARLHELAREKKAAAAAAAEKERAAAAETTQQQQQQQEASDTAANTAESDSSDCSDADDAEDEEEDASVVFRDDPVYAAERQALRDIFGALNGTHIMTVPGNWLNRHVDHCQWSGVTCHRAAFPNGNSSNSNSSTRIPVVTRLELPSQKLTGTVPPEVAQLSFLKVLYLNHNFLRGSLPSELQQLARLQHVHLVHNDLTGRLPPFRALVSLHAAHNCLTGGGLTELAAAAAATLQVVDVSDNCLFAAAAAASEERERGGGGNALSRMARAAANASSVLQYLFASDNFLTGPLPGDLDRLTALRTLDLARNRFTGELPDRLPASLRDLDLAGNRHFVAPASSSSASATEQQQQQFPPDAWLQQLTALQSLIVSDNRLAGSLPQQEWPALASSLGILKVDRNQLAGGLPADLYRATQLRHLDLSHNRFTGTIATEIGLVTSLQSFEAANNRLSGTIPNEMMKLNPNIMLNFTDNQFTGTIPSLFCGVGSMNMLYQEFGCDALLCRPGTFNVHGHATLHSACRPCPGSGGTNRSQFLGQSACEGLPPYVHGDLNGDGLRSPREILRILFVDTLGRFWGEEFQPWADIRRYPNECDLLGITCVNGQIARVDLSSAELCSNGIKSMPAAGPVAYCKGLPSEIGELTGLEVLQLTKRQFLRGTVPSEIGRLSLLRMLDFSTTAMSGTLPSEMGDLSNLKRLLLSHSRFQGKIPPELFALSSLEKLHLTNNKFNGALASEVANLKNVKEFMISRNKFSGTIPSEIGGMTKLENFEAYHNQFTGEIPSELGLCSSIKRIDIFNNSLNGALPKELGNANWLQIFHAKDNSITGTIPPEIGDLKYLTWLDVSKNRLTGSIPESFAKSTSIEDFRLGGNKLFDSVPRGLCTNPKINGGATKQHGCDGVICRTGTKSDDGHATVDRACIKCPEGMSNLYLGSSGCGFITEERILDMLYEVMEGASWREYGWYWNDQEVQICEWGGNACDSNGELETLAVPLMAASDLYD